MTYWLGVITLVIHLPELVVVLSACIHLSLVEFPLAHWDTLEHLFSTTHQPHRGFLSDTQLEHSLCKEHSSRGICITYKINKHKQKYKLWRLSLNIWFSPFKKFANLLILTAVIEVVNIYARSKCHWRVPTAWQMIYFKIVTYLKCHTIQLLKLKWERIVWN